MRKLVVITVLALLIGLTAMVSPAAASDWEDPEVPTLIVILSGAGLVGFQGEQGVSGQGWVVGDEVELYINDEYVDTVLAEPNAENNASPMFEITDWGVIKPGDEAKIVRVSDGLTKVHVVTSIAPTFVSLEADTVAGKADPDGNMLVGVLTEEYSFIPRFETADVNGDWLADFSMPGDEQGEESTFDITCNTFGLAAFQYDDDGDMSGVFWSPMATSKLVPMLAKEYGGLRKAVEALEEFDSVKELQKAIQAYCAGE